MAEADVTVDPAQFRALMASVKAFDPELAKALRKELRSIGKLLAVDMKARINQPPPTGGRSKGTHRSRSQVAAGIGVKIATAKKRQGLFLSSSSARLPAGRKPFARAYNKNRWRHRVFGSNVWVTQKGRPYFGGSIRQREPEIQAAIQTALQAALDTINSGS